MREVVISPLEAGQRLDKFCLRYLGRPPKTFVFKMLRKKNISVNGKRADEAYMLAVGDVVRFFISDETILQFAKPEKSYPKGHIDVIFENEDILIVNKPAGLLTQPNETGGDSLVGRLRGKLALFAPTAINRLDRNTSGIVICAKNLPTAQRLSEMIRDRRIGKVYLGVAQGHIKEKMVLTGVHFKDEKSNIATICMDERYLTTAAGKDVLTEVVPIGSVSNTTSLKIHLHTGRSHQIRAHLQSIGHPLLGDRKYGGAGAKRQLLHAYQIAFPKDFMNGQAFTAPIPPDMLEYFKGVRL